MVQEQSFRKTFLTIRPTTTIWDVSFIILAKFQKFSVVLPTFRWPGSSDYRTTCLCGKTATVISVNLTIPYLHAVSL